MTEALRDPTQEALLALRGLRGTHLLVRRRRQSLERVDRQRFLRGVRVEVEERWRSVVRVFRQREEGSSQRGRREGRHVAVRVAVADAQLSVHGTRLRYLSRGPPFGRARAAANVGHLVRKLGERERQERVPRRIGYPDGIERIGGT